MGAHAVTPDQRRGGPAQAAGGGPRPLPQEIFAQVVKLTPLVSIDLVLRDPGGRVLVGLRNNEPAKDFYFVPGGVVFKNEPLDDAFRRILAAETGLAAPRSAARFLGVFEHFWDTNFWSGAEFGTHYVVLAHELHVARPAELHDAQRQHRLMKWLSEPDLLADPRVHPRTKDYFTAR